MLTFVTFHVDLDRRTQDAIVKKVLTFTTYEPSRFIETMFRSARLQHPDCRCIVLSDQSTTFHLPEFIQIKRLEVDSKYPALSRLDAQIDFLDQLKDTTDVIFMDYDMLVCGDLSHIFDGTFDLFLCKRTDHPLVFNAGVIGVGAERQSQAAQFFNNVRGVLLKEFPAFKDWWGVQKSLDRYVGHDRVLQEKSDSILAGNARIRLLPGTIYNYSPANETEALDKSLMNTKKILHYKGLRKVFMFDYWDRYLKPKG